MADETDIEVVTEDQVAEVTAKLMQWSATLTEAEQLALASILEAAVGTDDTQGHIIIVGGRPAFQPAVIRGGVLRGIFSADVGPVSNLPGTIPTSDLRVSR